MPSNAGDLDSVFGPPIDPISGPSGAVSPAPGSTSLGSDSLDDVFGLPLDIITPKAVSPMGAPNVGPRPPIDPTASMDPVEASKYRQRVQEVAPLGPNAVALTDLSPEAERERVVGYDKDTGQAITDPGGWSRAFNSFIEQFYPFGLGKHIALQPERTASSTSGEWWGEFLGGTTGMIASFMLPTAALKLLKAPKAIGAATNWLIRGTDRAKQMAQATERVSNLVPGAVRAVRGTEDLAQALPAASNALTAVEDARNMARAADQISEAQKAIGALHKLSLEEPARYELVRGVLNNIALFGVHGQIQADLGASIEERAGLLKQAVIDGTLFGAIGAAEKALAPYLTKVGSASLGLTTMFGLGYGSNDAVPQEDRIANGLVFMALHGLGQRGKYKERVKLETDYKNATRDLGIPDDVADRVFKGLVDNPKVLQSMADHGHIDQSTVDMLTQRANTGPASEAKAKADAFKAEEDKLRATFDAIPNEAERRAKAVEIYKEATGEDAPNPKYIVRDNRGAEREVDTLKPGMTLIRVDDSEFERKYAVAESAITGREGQPSIYSERRKTPLVPAAEPTEPAVWNEKVPAVTNEQRTLDQSNANVQRQRAAQFKEWTGKDLPPPSFADPMLPGTADYSEANRIFTEEETRQREKSALTEENKLRVQEIERQVDEAMRGEYPRTQLANLYRQWTGKNPPKIRENSLMNMVDDSEFVRAFAEAEKKQTGLSYSHYEAARTIDRRLEEARFPKPTTKSQDVPIQPAPESIPATEPVVPPQPAIEPIPAGRAYVAKPHDKKSVGQTVDLGIGPGWKQPDYSAQIPPEEPPAVPPVAAKPSTPIEPPAAAPRIEPPSAPPVEPPPVEPTKPPAAAMDDAISAAFGTQRRPPKPPQTEGKLRKDDTDTVKLGQELVHRKTGQRAAIIKIETSKREGDKIYIRDPKTGKSLYVFTRSGWLTEEQLKQEKESVATAGKRLADPDPTLAALLPTKADKAGKPIQPIADELGVPQRALRTALRDAGYSAPELRETSADKTARVKWGRNVAIRTDRVSPNGEDVSAAVDRAAGTVSSLESDAQVDLRLTLPWIIRMRQAEEKIAKRTVKSPTDRESRDIDEGSSRITAFLNDYPEHRDLVSGGSADLIKLKNALDGIEEPGPPQGVAPETPSETMTAKEAAKSSLSDFLLNNAERGGGYTDVAKRLAGLLNTDNLMLVPLDRIRAKLDALKKWAEDRPEDRRETQKNINYVDGLLKRREAYDMEFVRGQLPADEPMMANPRAETSRRMSEHAQQHGGTWTEDKTNSGRIGTLRFGQWTVEVHLTPQAKGRAGSFREKPGRMFRIEIDPANGRVTTPIHETMHFALRALRPHEAHQLRRALGYDVTTFEGEERMVQTMTTPEGRKEIGYALRKATPESRYAIVRWINRSVDLINRVYGKISGTLGRIPKLGEARQWENTIRAFEGMEIFNQMARGERPGAMPETMSERGQTFSTVSPKHDRLYLKAVKSGDVWMAQHLANMSAGDGGNVEAIVRDENGKVIPLSQRFRPQMVSVTPEQSARFAELEQKAKSGDASARAEAEKMVADIQRANGYVVDIFHGTISPKPFTIFRNPDRGIWTAFDPNNAVPGSGESSKRRMDLRADPGSNPVTLTESEFEDWRRPGGNPLQWMRKFYLWGWKKNHTQRPTSVRIGDYALVVFEPSQLKSIEPFTYAKDGSLIPLSERGSRASYDIRYHTPSSSPFDVLKKNEAEYIKQRIAYRSRFKGGGEYDPNSIEDFKKWVNRPVETDDMRRAKVANEELKAVAKPEGKAAFGAMTSAPRRIINRAAGFMARYTTTPELKARLVSHEAGDFVREQIMQKEQAGDQRYRTIMKQIETERPQLREINPYEKINDPQLGEVTRDEIAAIIRTSYSQPLRSDGTPDPTRSGLKAMAISGVMADPEARRMVITGVGENATKAQLDANMARIRSMVARLEREHPELKKGSWYYEFITKIQDQLKGMAKESMDEWNRLHPDNPVTFEDVEDYANTRRVMDTKVRAVQVRNDLMSATLGRYGWLKSKERGGDRAILLTGLLDDIDAKTSSVREMAQIPYINRAMDFVASLDETNMARTFGKDYKQAILSDISTSHAGYRDAQTPSWLRRISRGQDLARFSDVMVSMNQLASVPPIASRFGLANTVRGMRAFGSAVRKGIEHIKDPDLLATLKTEEGAPLEVRLTMSGGAQEMYESRASENMQRIAGHGNKAGTNLSAFRDFGTAPIRSMDRATVLTTIGAALEAGKQRGLTGRELHVWAAKNAFEALSDLQPVGSRAFKTTLHNTPIAGVMLSRYMTVPNAIANDFLRTMLNVRRGKAAPTELAKAFVYNVLLPSALIAGVRQMKHDLYDEIGKIWASDEELRRKALKDEADAKRTANQTVPDYLRDVMSTMVSQAVAPFGNILAKPIDYIMEQRPGMKYAKGQMIAQDPLFGSWIQKAAAIADHIIKIQNIRKRIDEGTSQRDDYAALEQTWARLFSDSLTLGSEIGHLQLSAYNRMAGNPIGQWLGRAAAKR